MSEEKQCHCCGQIIKEKKYIPLITQEGAIELLNAKSNMSPAAKIEFIASLLRGTEIVEED